MQPQLEEKQFMSNSNFSLWLVFSLSSCLRESLWETEGHQRLLLCDRNHQFQSEQNLTALLICSDK